MPTAGPALKPGSSLIKAWRGVRHEVRVLEEGFGYQGERFSSLSAVAFRITGTKWNGHVFLDLKARTWPLILRTGSSMGDSITACRSPRLRLNLCLCWNEQRHLIAGLGVRRASSSCGRSGG